MNNSTQLQLRHMVDMSKLYQTYAPVCKISDLQNNPEQKNELGNVAKAYQSLQKKNLGLNILVTCTDVQTGIKAVETLATNVISKLKIMITWICMKSMVVMIEFLINY